MLSALSAEGADFLVVGGWALAAHGFPRATKDLDILVRPTAENARRVLRALRKFGAPLEGISERDIEDPELVLQIGVEPYRIDVVSAIDGVTFDEAWAGRIQAEFGASKVWVLGRKEFLRNKRTVGRPRDIADADLLEGGQ
jgi:hypothetical protein